MDDWQAIVFDQDLNSVHKNRICQHFFMVERNEGAGKALDKFYLGSKKDRLSDVKIVTYQDILRNITTFSTRPLKAQKQSNHLYNLAAKDTSDHLANNDQLPHTWMANLIKLHIMYLIDEDVTETQKHLMLESNLNNERTELLNPVEMKRKAQPFDVSNPNNVYQFKTNTRFKTAVVEKSLFYESIPVESKELFFVIIGFYDFQLFTRLFEANVPCIGFIQIIEPGFEPYEIDVRPPGKKKRMSNKAKALLEFWKKFYDQFENENYDLCFQNTYHMAVCPPSFAFETDYTTTTTCIQVFNSISTELLQFVEIQRCYINYIRNLKICHVGPKPNLVLSANYPLYNKIMNLLPPECFNVPFLLYAMLEQLKDLFLPHLSAKVSRKPSEIFVNYEIPVQTVPTHKSLRSCIGDVINRTASPFYYRSDTDLSKYYNSAKINLKISRKQFLTHERDFNYIRISPYEKIRGEYLRINLEVLEKCRSSLLWKQRNSKEMQILLNKYNLKNLADTLQLSLQELQYALHVVLFHSIKCNGNAPVTGCNNSFTSLFPMVEDNAPNVTNLSSGDKSATMCEIPNSYETRNLASFKWYDKLTSDVMLQELVKAEENYVCMDYKFNAFDDTILLRFHNNLDQFGVNRRVWNQSLRTRISLKEFCRYIISEDCVWLQIQEEQFLKDREKEYDEQVRAEEAIKKNFYPELFFSDTDFLQPGSFKAKALIQERKSISSPMTAPIATLEKLAQPPQPPSAKKLSLHLAEESTFRFYGYDHCDQRFQLKGSTILFCSQDGVKVTVDQTRFLRAPNTMSINVSVDGHSLVLHKNDLTWSEPLTFHFSLANQTIVAFGKPLKPTKPESKLCSSLYQAIANGNTNLRQQVYFVSESQSHVLKCFDMPMVTKKNLILTQDLLNPFLEEIAKRKIPVKYLVSNETLSKEEITEIKNALASSSKLAKCENPRRKNTAKFITFPKSDSITEDVIEEVRNIGSRVRQAVPSETISILKKSNKKLLEIVKEAAKAQLPIFKICSSRLHKNHYVKRLKSFVSVPEETLIKRLAIKPHVHNMGSEIRITKLLPIKPLIDRNYPKYNLKISLPSGLMVEIVPGTNNMLFCVKQNYLEVGPTSKSMISEVSRTLLRNGMIVIKRSDGNMSVFNVNGEVVNCDLPLIKEKGTNAKRKRKIFSYLTYLHAYGTDLPKFKKHMQKVVHRLEKRVIGQTFTSYGKSKGSSKLKNCKSGVYLLQNSLTPFTKLSLITCDGKTITTVKTAIMQEKKFYRSTTTDYLNQEMLFSREDGTHSLLNRESVLVTQFPDGSRISSWLYVEPELIYIVEEPTRCNIACDKQEQASLYSDTESTGSTAKTLVTEMGWVSIYLNMKFEHPNFATVVYYGANNYTDIIVPGNIIVKMTELGEYHMEIGERVVANITCDKLVLESRLCHNCSEKCTTTLNVKPYFEKEKDALNSSKLELLRVVDSFRKKFIVNYDGKCYKSTEHTTARGNKAYCELHRPSEYQQLFVLTRSLNGCKFWDIPAYQRKLNHAQKHVNTSIKTSQQQQFSLSIFETSIDVPTDDEFILPYKINALTLSKQRVPKSDKPYFFYVKRLILRALPNVQILLPFYRTLNDMLTDNFKIIWSGASEFCIFYSDILVEFKNNKRSEKKAKLLVEAKKVELKGPAVRLFERLNKWKRDCAAKMVSIRQNSVPLYYESKQRENIMRKLSPESSHSKSERTSSEEVSLTYSEDDDICHEDYESVSIENETKIDEPNLEDVKTEPSCPKNIPQVPNVRYSTKQELINSAGAIEIFNEVISSFSSFLKNVEDKNEHVSVQKVEHVAEKIYNNILCADKEFDFSHHNDYIMVASTIIVKNVACEGLNTTEMRYLLNLLSDPIKPSEETCKDMYNSSCKPCSNMPSMPTDRYYMSQHMVESESSLSDSFIIASESTQSESAYKIYSCYSGKPKATTTSLQVTPSDEKQKSRGSSLTVVYESSDVQKDNEDTLDSNAKYLVRSSHMNLLESTGANEVCTKCIETTSFWKNYANIYSEEPVHFESFERRSSGDLNETEGPKHFSPSTEMEFFESNESVVLTGSGSRTVALNRNVDELPSDSMMVLFSMASLKGRNMESVPHPYIERDPNEVHKHLYGATSPAKENKTKSKLIETALRKCPKCIKKRPSLKKESLTEVVNRIRTDNLLFNSKTEIAGSVLNILKSEMEEPNMKKPNKNVVYAEITNTDAKLVTENCPPSLDSALTYKIPHQPRKGEIVRKSVGVVTQEGTTDKSNQTQSVFFS